MAHDNASPPSVADFRAVDVGFHLPTCRRHFLGSHRWWCRGCRREAHDQFREVCELLWRIRRGCSHRWHELHGSGQVCSLCNTRRGA